jgi:hypothetical protein
MEEMQLLIDVTEELQNKADASMQNILWNKRSIYKVPASVTALNRAAYRPQTVSIGPYHSYDDQLKPMEEHKHRALYYFLKRSGKSLELFLLSLNEVVQDLKDSYDQLDKSWNDDTGKFLQLMILDGCFMLEIMRLAIQPSNDYVADDPVFSIHGRVYVAPFIRRDMLIVENQLPMLVLYKLVATESDGEKVYILLITKSRHLLFILFTINFLLLRRMKSSSTSSYSPFVTPTRVSQRGVNACMYWIYTGRAYFGKTPTGKGVTAEYGVDCIKMSMILSDLQQRSMKLESSSRKVKLEA